MRTLTDLNFFQRRVLVRADLDVPIKKNHVEDFSRLRQLANTINYLISSSAKVIIIGHIGRPGGHFVSSLTTEILAAPLSKILNKPVTHFSIAIGTEINQSVAEMKPTDVFLLENLRFYPGEESNDIYFAKALASLGDIYVNDAFAACHRQHASIVSLPSLLPSAAGLHLSKEVEKLLPIFQNPERPYLVIIGGVKIETKLPLIKAFSKLADYVLVAGKLPLEIRGSFDRKLSNVIVAHLEKNGFDINLQSIEKFKSLIKTAATVVWNGPMGVFENEQFATGTRAIVEILTGSNAKVVIGGGDTIAAARKFTDVNKFYWVSSGGGAMLEFLTKGTLPGIQALS